MQYVKIYIRMKPAEPSTARTFSIQTEALNWCPRYEEIVYNVER